MRVLRRGALPLLAALVALAAASGAATADWPTAFDYTVGVSTAHDSGIQISGLLSGPLSPEMTAKVGAWWVTRSDNNRAFMGDVYVDYTKAPVYLAVGRKYIPLGPAGVLASPGITGGELKLTYDRVRVQAIAGTLSFTPLVGGTRFTYAGNRAPADERLTAGRLEVTLTEPESETPAVVGVNVLDILDETGRSVDASVWLNQWLSVYGEWAEFDDVRARACGFRLSDEKIATPPNLATIVQIYYRKVPVGFVPAMVGASGYFENLDGWAGGIYQALPNNYAVGLFADKNDAILTLFGHVDLQ